MITYCTNIHPGERWGDVFLNLRTHLPVVKQAVSPQEPFPVGLRLGNYAANEMDERKAGEFHAWCGENGFFVPTINGFPYGIFHDAAIKERVYLPDWRSEERLSYTKRLAWLLDQWLPEGVRGSISTVPIGFKTDYFSGDDPAVKRNLIGILEYLDRLKQKSGKEIILAIEPEPACVIETTHDVIDFIEKMELPAELQQVIGVCFDCCHQAVEFEEASESLQALAAAGVLVAKMQISSALRMQSPNRIVLEQFSDPTYLHQVVIKSADGSLKRYADIPEALARHSSAAGEEWRVHFHLPIFLAGAENYETTQSFITKALSFVAAGALLEIETYTWDILPSEMKMAKVTDSIIREIKWLKDQKHATHRSF